jgi:hypothetical protein
MKWTVQVVTQTENGEESVRTVACVERQELTPASLGLAIADSKAILQGVSGHCRYMETVYRHLFPQLNLRQWAGSIYTWLTHPVLDPTHSGRVTMDSLMKLVTTALEWTYEARETDVQARTIEKAAQLLVLRRDTLQIIDGAGPSVDVSRPDGAAPGSMPETEPHQETRRANGQQHTTPTVDAQAPPSPSAKCTFAGVVAIDLTRFADSGVALVECPDCARMRSLSPRKGVLRFPSHDRRKLQTTVTGVRWAAIGKTDWGVVGGEPK